MTLLLVLLAIIGGIQRPTDVVRWSAAAPAKAVVPGGVAKIELTAKIEDGWKLYALSQVKGGPVPLSIVVEKGAPFTLAPKAITGPLPKLQKDDNFNLETQYYEHEAVFALPVTVARTAGGKQRVPLDITFQACGAAICLRPFTLRVEVDISVSR
jgi:thiol:disulfide interchange protein DsbD